MNFEINRRDFLTGSVKLGAAAATVAAVPSAIAAAFAAAPESAHGDLLRALGTRIGLDAAAEIGTFGEPLSVQYFDAAGASVDALREGIEDGARLGVSCGAVCVESSLPYSDVLGIAFFRDAHSGRTARVEILASALTQIELISQGTRSGSLQKQAIMSASADSLYTLTASSSLRFA
jgi:hypothetical protein